VKKIADILHEFDMIKENNGIQRDQLHQFVEMYAFDERAGIQRLVNRAKKIEEDYVNELSRVNTMLSFEKMYDVEARIGGVDEAGRGPLAGPVVAACVILDLEDPILYVDDSKKLTAQKREVLYDEITQRAIAYGIGIVHRDDIDSMNILNATYKAMYIAVNSMKVYPTQLLNDAVIIPNITIPQEKIIHGDAKSLSIAAASIIAKVTRDRIMVAYDELYPEYGFKDHKGYGSATHIDAIKKYGPCELHRQTFIKNFV